MANKPIIDIDVNDEQFKSFLDLYDQFHTSLQEIPEDWAKVGKESKSAFNAIGAAMLAQNTLLTKNLRGQREFNEEARKSALSWEKLSQHTKAAAGHIVDATKSLVRWTGAATIVSGLLGAGSLFGIDRLGHAVTAGRRSSAGLGVSYGQQQAFGLNFGRYADPGSVLGSVSTGLFDVTSPEYLALLRAGVSPKQLEGGNAADIGASLLEKIPKLFGNVPANQRGLLANTYGFSQLGIGPEAINRYLAASPEERAKQQREYRGNASDLDLTKGQQRAWNDLTTMLDRAGKMIENTFVTGLAPLAPGLEKLSDGVSIAFKAFLGSDAFKEWITKAGDGLKWLGTYLSSPEFKKDAEDFAKALGDLASAIVKTVRFISSFTRHFIEDEYPPAAPGAPRPPLESPDGGDIYPPSKKRSFWDGALRPWPFYGLDKPMPVPTPPKTLDFGNLPLKRVSFANDNAVGALPQGLLARIAYAESGFNPNAVSPKGAQGMFQFMPGTAKQYGVTNPFDPAESARGASDYLMDLLKQFKGGLRKSVAAYNWGPGNVDKDVREHGEDWESHIPAETRNYLAKVLGGGAMPARDQVPRARPEITINNNTGGSATLTGSQVAA